MYWPSLQGLIFKGKTHQLMALLNYLIWKDNGLYYLQSWLQEKRSPSNILYLFTIRSKLLFFFFFFFHERRGVGFFFVLELFSSPFSTCQHWSELFYGNPCISSFKWGQYPSVFLPYTYSGREKVSDREFRLRGKAVTVHSRILFFGINLN